jgi:hypothetical protein
LPDRITSAASQDRGFKYEAVVESPDSELIYEVEFCGLAQDDRVAFEVTEAGELQIDNFGSQTSYDIRFECRRADTALAGRRESVTLSEFCSHLIMPEWEPCVPMVILVDGMFQGSHSDSVLVDDPDCYVCGDANGSGDADIDDVVYLINYIFYGGPAPVPEEAGDANCSGDVDIDDVVYLIGFVFTNGNPPCDPDGDGIPDC